MGRWTNENGEYQLHVEGYKSKYNNDVIADFAMSEVRKNTALYVCYCNNQTGELRSDSVEYAKEQVEGIVKSFLRQQLEYYDNLLRCL